MKTILLDTNIFIYREDSKELNNDIQALFSCFNEDSFKLCYHPITKDELNKIKDEPLRKSSLSKLEIYTKLKDTPTKFPEEWNLPEANEHDYNDNLLLLALYKNCVDYLVTNDKRLIKKGKEIDSISKRVLSVEEAFNMFENKNKDIKTNYCIENKPLSSIDISDDFLSSLKYDYPEFEEWFIKKQRLGIEGYMARYNNQLRALLILKKENNENYNHFSKPLLKNKNILKVSTFKVGIKDKALGEGFIRIIYDYALNNDIELIYVTIFEKHEKLINLFEKFNFEKYCINNNTGEIVYVRDMNQIYNNFPFINFNSKLNKALLIPIQYDYAHELFGSVVEEKFHQISFLDGECGVNYQNKINNVYLSNSNIKKIKKNDILFFYLSQHKRKIKVLGLVKGVKYKEDFKDIDDFRNYINRRTFFTFDQVKKYYQKKNLVCIDFQQYLNNNDGVELEELNIPFPQSISEINDFNKIKKIINKLNAEKCCKLS